ncbi:hypothetical protein [Rhodococcus ruber]|uniref:hypothetical protein n=1 Tax=Rhodococcus ruber TaxID=1830 RepID=UPI001F2F8217|nr:hypothetical protein [Rhodococcus ruber]MCF8786846.1 hypothetical protein [Rhodococcus ruber]
MDGLRFALGLILTGILWGGVLLVVIIVTQGLLSKIWRGAASPRAGLVLTAVLAIGPVAAVAVPALLQNWRNYGYFGLIAVGVAMVCVPWAWHLTRQSTGEENGTK